jgi:hypothetical protein
LLAGIVSPALAGETDKGTRQKMVTATYQVADLIVPVRDASFTAGPGAGKPAQPVKTTEEELIKRLTKSVAPASWVDAGGPGTIDYFPLSMSLVINQSPAIQEQVADLLTALRREKDLQVVVEIRFLSRPAEAPVARAGTVTYLDDAETRRFVEAAQAEPRTNLMQAPKMTLFNDQKCTIAILSTLPLRAPFQIAWENGLQFTAPRTEKVTVGTRVSVRPAVAVDRRSVRADLEVELSALDSLPSLFGCQRLDVLRVATAVTPKVGQTVRLELGQHEVKVAPEPIPFLSKLPVVGSLLRELGTRTENEHLVVLVTPRIIDQASEVIGTPEPR